MDLTNNKIRIQNALTGLAYNHRFPKITYSQNHNEASVSTHKVHPTVAYANEVSSEFDKPERNRRGRLRERKAWKFEFKLSFSVEVSLESFEKSLTDPPLLLSKTTDLPQTEIDLISAEIQHPVLQEGSTGTSVSYTIEANEYPI
jgi:hypothetical protein